MLSQVDRNAIGSARAQQNATYMRIVEKLAKQSVAVMMPRCFEAWKRITALHFCERETKIEAYIKLIFSKVW